MLEISGVFHRTVPTDRVAEVLAPPRADSAGRYHRHGQPALYLSPSADWARTAVSGYMREDGQPRAIVPLRVTGARVVDQRDPDACRAWGIDRAHAAMPWRPALRRQETPPSWTTADRVRATPADGLIDVSRHIPEGWHLVLFRWNAPGGPTVVAVGDPILVHPRRDGPKWA